MQIGKFFVDETATIDNQHTFEVSLVGRKRPVHVTIVDDPDGEKISIEVTNRYIYTRDPVAKLELEYDEIMNPPGACMAE